MQAEFSPDFDPAELAESAPPPARELTAADDAYGAWVAHNRAVWQRRTAAQDAYLAAVAAADADYLDPTRWPEGYGPADVPGHVAALTTAILRYHAAEDDINNLAPEGERLRRAWEAFV